jgi:hypothetical protein
MTTIDIGEADHAKICFFAVTGLTIVCNQHPFEVKAINSGFEVKNPSGKICRVPKTRDVRYRIKTWKPGQLWA